MKNDVIYVRISADMKQKLIKLAEADRRSTSDFVVQLIIKEIEKAEKGKQG